VSFDDDTALERKGDGRYVGAVADGWKTAIAPLGGYVGAIVLRGLQDAIDDPSRLPRSLTLHFLRPAVSGPVELTTTVERQGRTLTTATGRLDQAGRTIVLAFASFSAGAGGHELGGDEMPKVDPPSERFPPKPEGAPPIPFLDQVVLESRFAGSGFPGNGVAEVGGWMGLREERPVDALAMTMLADAWYPAVFPRLGGPAPAPTIELTVLFRAPEPVPDTLILGRFHNRLLRDGFFDEDGELWTPDGVLVAQSRQIGMTRPPRTRELNGISRAESDEHSEAD
jgi:acyl-CoA thioesterase